MKMISLRNAQQYLINEEELIGQLQDAVHMDNTADAVHINISYQTQNHHSLHKQLSVLWLRDVVQDRLHLHCELYLPSCHLHRKHYETHIHNQIHKPNLIASVEGYLACGRRWQYISING